MRAPVVTHQIRKARCLSVRSKDLGSNRDGNNTTHKAHEENLSPGQHWSPFLCPLVTNSATAGKIERTETVFLLLNSHSPIHQDISQQPT